MTHLYKKLEIYSQSDYYPFHMPGHKRNRNSVDGEIPIDQDITEIDGFDNLHHAEDVILKAQKDAAELYGVQETFFSVNGSTAGLLSAVSAAVKKGGKILVARNCHKSVYHAMYLRDLCPVYLYPEMQKEYRINGGILPEDVENALNKDSEIQAVLITSPTYDGVVSDVNKIAEIAHKHNLPLIVDEAHGAHFIFHEYFPESAIKLGADLVIQSLHKTLPSMTQTAVLHRCSERVNRELLVRYMGIYQSSSPSYILMSSIDACINKIKKDGQKMFHAYTENLNEARECLKKCRNLKLIPYAITGKDGVYDYDRSKILISTIGTSLNGNTLSDILRKKYHLEMEMTEENYVTALTSVGDTKEGFDRLCHALLEIDASLKPKINLAQESVEKQQEADENQICIPLKQELRISDAMEELVEKCILEESEGCISAEFAYYYPPGIPIITPGEKITSELLKKIIMDQQKGFQLQGLSDYENKTILVVKNVTVNK